MTWVDAIVLLLVLVYTILGFYSGIIRRVLGFVILFFAFYVAGYMGLRAGDMIVQARPLTPPTDARVIGYFGFALLVVVVLEAMATAYRDLLQVSVVALNKFTGVLLGVLTGLVASVLVVYMLNGAGNPLGGSLNSTQLSIKEGVDRSVIAKPLLNALGRPVLFFFRPVLPGDPQLYFEKG